MNVIANNCVSTITVPVDAQSGGRKIFYNPLLKLFVTMGTTEGISVWNPVTGKVIDLTDLGSDGCLDMGMAPRNHVVMSYSEGNHGGVVEIYSLEKLSENSEPKPVLSIKRSLLPGHPGMIALSPLNTLLVVDGFGDSDVWDIYIDWDQLKVVKARLLESNDALVPEEQYIGSLCCTPEYSIIEGLPNWSNGSEDDVFSLLVGRMCSTKLDQIIKDGENNDSKEEEQGTQKVVEEQKGEEAKEERTKKKHKQPKKAKDVDDTDTIDDSDDNDDRDDSDENDSDGDNSTDEDDDVINIDLIEIKRDAIDYCILDGLEYKLNHVTGFIHDGQNLLILSEGKIVLLETLTNGSKAHLIASHLENCSKGLGINHKGQLMVCNGEESIMIFDYRCIPRSLQDLCRCCISEAIPSSYRDSIEKLSLPETLTSYLLFKDVGY